MTFYAEAYREGGIDGFVESARPCVDLRIIEQRMRAKLDDWRGLLHAGGRHPPGARLRIIARRGGAAPHRGR
jgi:hypothetical protein